MLVNIVPCTILVVFSFAHVHSQVKGTQNRFDVDGWMGVHRREYMLSELDRTRFAHDNTIPKRNQKIHLNNQLANNTYFKPYRPPIDDANYKIRFIKSFNDRYSKLDNATTTTTVSYFMNSQSSTEENVDKIDENSTDNKLSGFYKVTTTTTLSYIPNSQSSSDGTVDDNVNMQEKNSSEKNYKDIYGVTTKTTVSYFVDSPSSNKETDDDNGRVQNSTEKRYDFGNVTSVDFVSTVTTVPDAENIANDNKTNITMKDTWIKRRGLFILIPAVLVVIAALIALVVWRPVNIVACFNKRGNYDVQGGFLRLNACERNRYDTFEHVQFIPHQ
ncbi:unnamed protein product [Spodoptera littoralis]|uniref:Uncharacterized protein n=1 Tax=Spodoptera littoralis TaxID=7109 RepID=A0A9P0IHN2_SPOLI|nr:unnamed protein product [Spodoptera littoralis]CAH1645976.1 unnamed protein product [Spodoptera littoralis]